MDAESLPQGAAPVDFQKVVDESKANLAAATEPKRGRGRPPGTTKKAQENPAPASETARPVEAVILKENEIEPLSAEIVKAPFDLVGWRTGIDITPTDEEAKAPSKYLSKLIECYLPDLDAKDPKKFNAIALVITLALLALKKMRIFTAQKKSEIKNQESPSPAGKETAPNAESIIPKAPQRPLPTESIPAGDIFSRGPG